MTQSLSKWVWKEWGYGKWRLFDHSGKCVGVVHRGLDWLFSAATGKQLGDYETKEQAQAAVLSELERLSGEEHS